jgi:DNA-binding MarR family transcriptional regulator
MCQLETDPGADLRDALGTDLGWLLGQTLRGYLRMADRAGGGIPGGMRGYHVLTAAANGCVTTQLGLARQLGLDRTVMTHLIDDLEAAGLIQRAPAPTDRRAKQVVVTPAGRKQWEHTTGLLARAEDHLLAPLDQESRATLRSLLRQLVGQPADEGLGEMCAIADDLRSGC